MTTSSWIVSVRRLSVLAGVMLGIAISFPSAQAGDDSKGEAGNLEGTWFTHVTSRDCQTGAVLREFSAINTFNKGETMIDTTAVISPALRSPGLGKWDKIGPQTYSATSLALLFSPAGSWTGTQKLTHTIQVNGDQNAFKSTVQFFDTNGTLTSSGCATAVGQRL